MAASPSFYRYITPDGVKGVVVIPTDRKKHLLPLKISRRDLISVEDPRVPSLPRRDSTTSV